VLCLRILCFISRVNQTEYMVLVEALTISGSCREASVSHRPCGLLRSNVLSRLGLLGWLPLQVKTIFYLRFFDGRNEVIYFILLKGFSQVFV